MCPQLSLQYLLLASKLCITWQILDSYCKVAHLNGLLVIFLDVFMLLHVQDINEANNRHYDEQINHNDEYSEAVFRDLDADQRHDQLSWHAGCLSKKDWLIVLRRVYSHSSSSSISGILAPQCDCSGTCRCETGSELSTEAAIDLIDLDFTCSFISTFLLKASDQLLSVYGGSKQALLLGLLCRVFKTNKSTVLIQQITRRSRISHHPGIRLIIFGESKCIERIKFAIWT